MKFAVSLLELAIKQCKTVIDEINVDLKKNPSRKTKSKLWEDLQLNQQLMNEYNDAIKVINASIINGCTKCPICGDDNVFTVELRHSRCNKCDFRWTN